MVTATRKKGREERGEGREKGHGMFGRGPTVAGDVSAFADAFLGKKKNGKAAAATSGKLKVKNAKCKTQNEETPATVRREEVLSADILVDRIDRCRFQPREDFPKEEIQKLADDIAAHGQIHPITVRLSPEHQHGGLVRYELVDGERRWRAVQLLGWKEVRAEIHRHTDAQVRAIVLATALQRKELNAIEEAKAFRAAIDAGDAPGPTELAKQLGLSQGHVSNRLRLLELPEAWQKRIISRKIPATHARSIARYAASPPILAAIDKHIQDLKRWGEGIGSSEEFDDGVDDCAARVTKPMDGKQYCQKIGKDVPTFTPTDEQRTQLGLVEVPVAKGVTTLRATNVRLWESLQAEHVARLVAKADKRGTTKDAKATKEKPLTEAERKRIEAEEAKKAKERARQFARRLYEWKENWMRYLIAEHLTTCADLNQVARVLMLGLSEWGCGRSNFDIGDAMGNGKRLHAVRNLFSVQAFDLDKVGGRLAAQMFYDAGNHLPAEPVRCVFGRDLESLCEFGLEIDMALEWSNHQAGPLSETYWRLHTKDQLIALAGELRAGFPDEILRGSKDQLVDAFLALIPKEEDKDAGLPIPKEILKAKGR